MSNLSRECRQSVLPCGLRLISIARPGTPTVAIRAYIRAGSRYDSDASQDRPLPGLAHLVEHMIFQGTETRSHKQLFQAVERFGGILDAHTAKEYMVVNCVIPRQGLDTAIEVMAALLLNPALTEDRFWPEKLVVLEEIRRAQDQHSILYDLFAQTLWKIHPLRWPIRGTLQGLKEAEHADLVEFYSRRFVSGNMLVVVCGNVEHEHAQQLMGQYFAGIPSGPEQLPIPCEELKLTSPASSHMTREINQLYLLIGVPTVSMSHPDRSALKIIERILGMGGSARFYQRLREQKQLVYSVNTVTAHYEDAGYFAVQTACNPDKLADVQQAIINEWDQLAQESVTEQEMAFAKSNYAGTLARKFETNLALAGIYGVEGLLNQVETLEEAVERVNAVKQADILRVSRQYLSTKPYVMATIGPETPHHYNPGS